MRFPGAKVEWLAALVSEPVRIDRHDDRIQEIGDPANEEEADQDRENPRNRGQLAANLTGEHLLDQVDLQHYQDPADQHKADGQERRRAAVDRLRPSLGMSSMSGWD